MPDFNFLGPFIAFLIGLVPVIVQVLDPASRLYTLLPKIIPSLTKAIFYDSYFVAVPMTSVQKSEYWKIKKSVEELIAVVKRQKNLGIFPLFVRVRSFGTKANFDSPKTSFEKSLVTIKRSNNFILIYPNRLNSEHAPSSTLLEAGVAIAMEKPIVVFKQKEAEVPYLLKEAANVRISRLNIKVYAYTDVGDLLDRVKAEGIKSIFLSPSSDVRRPRVNAPSSSANLRASECGIGPPGIPARSVDP